MRAQKIERFWEILRALARLICRPGYALTPRKLSCCEKFLVAPLHSICSPQNFLFIFRTAIYSDLFFSIYTLLALSWRRSLWYRNQFIDLHSKSLNCFLYDRDHRHERVKTFAEAAIHPKFEKVLCSQIKKRFPKKNSRGSPKYSNNAHCLPAFNKWISKL